ncbi:MAG: glycerophosphodiester phosphodiesterase [Chloroflexi bacterium]|nr:glycerophosphodiester phosphodiesterase [Chloroflexota bacterium]
MKIELLKSITGRVLVESHRGAEGLAPENSWTALKLGRDSGADLLEVDVQLSQDGVAFLRHNYSLPDSRWCSAVPWSELKDIRIEHEPLPRLDDVLAWACENNVYLSLDIKVGFKPEKSLTTVVLSALEVTQAWEQVMLISWDHVELLDIKKTYPKLTTRALINGRLAAYSEFLKYTQADAISLSYGIVRPRDVEEIHRAGVAVIMGEMWRPDFEMINDLDIDMVSWSDPNEARRLLGQIP